MGISIVTELIKDVPLSSWIALSALVISLISLYISIRKLNYERKLESARKRTELMNRLSDSKENLENSLNYCKLARPFSRECKDRWQAHLPKIERNMSIKPCMTSPFGSGVGTDGSSGCNSLSFF